MTKLTKLAEQRKNQQANKIEIKTLKQTHDLETAENLPPMTTKLSEVHKSTKKLEVKKSDSEKENTQELTPIEDKLNNLEDETVDKKSAVKNLPNNSKFSRMIKETLVSLMKSRSSPRTEQDVLGQASINDIPIQTLGGDSLKRKDNIYELTPEKKNFVVKRIYW